MRWRQHRTAAHAQPARSLRVFPRARLGAPVGDDPWALLELRVTRIADLVLKVSGLLEQSTGRAPDPQAAERRARLLWVVEHGRAALQAAVSAPDGAIARTPSPGA